MGRELLEDHLVILVEPIYLFLRKQLPDDGCCVNRTEREWFELQKLAKLRLAIGRDEQGVFYAHSKAPGEIDARLVGDGHSCHEWGWFPLHTNLVRALMDVQIGAHAMARSVQIVQALAPQRLSRQNIYLRATGAAGELAQFYLDMSLQHESIDAPLLVCQRAQGNGARNVCRAVEILCATIEQQKTFRQQRHVSLCRSLIVDDSPVGLGLWAL